MATSDSELAFYNFLAPRYWLTWLGLGCLRLAVLLPYRVQMKLGAMLGALMVYMLPARRRIAQINIGLCFPELDASQQRALVNNCFRFSGKSLFETALCWWGGNARLQPLAHVTGLEHVHAALQQGRGVMLLSAHFTCLEMGAHLLGLHLPINVMYKRHRNELFESVMKHARERRFNRAINHHDVRGLVRSLKDGNVVWYAPDQDFGTRQSVFVPFMGISAATLTAPARFAQLSGALVLPFFPRNLGHGRGYQLEIFPALENFPSGSEMLDAERINRLIEERVRKTPDQYLWLHRRFKTRPLDEAPLYPARRRKRRA